LKPLLTCYEHYYKIKKLCGIILEATVEEGHPHSGLKNVMMGTLGGFLQRQFSLLFFETFFRGAEMY
jgi:hypothetical protein